MIDDDTHTAKNSQDSEQQTLSADNSFTKTFSTTRAFADGHG